MSNLTNVGQLDRKKYIGGSDVAGILGVSPWKTPLQVYLAKTEQDTEVITEAKQKIFNRGKRMEPYLIDLLSEELGITIKDRGNRYIDSEHDFIAAEIDAETVDGRNVEIKTANQFSASQWGDKGSDEIPVYYAAQAMHGLMVTGKDECIFGVLIGSDDFRTYVIKRDQETIDAIRQKELDFWNNHVLKGVPPEPTNVDDIKKLYGKDSGSIIEADRNIETDIIVLKSLKDELKALEDRIETHENNIKMYLKDHATLTLHGLPVATYKSQQAKRFDSTAFKAKHPDLYEQFIKVTESRIFRVK